MHNKLTFVGCTPFPNGLASSNRLTSLLCELPKYGWEVAVVNFSPSKFPNAHAAGKFVYERNGKVKGVRYYSTSLTVKASRYKLLRIISALWGLAILPFFLLFKLKPNRHDHTIFLTNQTQVHYVIYLKFLSLLLNAKFVLLSSEFPVSIRNKSRVIYLYHTFVENWIFKLFDGFALMTFTLEDYFKPVSKKHAIFEIIPMTVDLNRFAGQFSTPHPFKYIAYAGSLSNEKDGVDILISAFIRIASKHQDIDLVIIGDNSESNFYEKLKKLIQKEGAAYQHRIHFTGLIDSSLIPQYLSNASILALARPNSIQAQGGFPTKLGEYLATGNPVIVTSVGEIPTYLKHLKNAILCKPGCIEDFSNQLDWALSNTILLHQIGAAGQKVALEVFNSAVQGKRFSKFLKNLN